jgi:hypothetical protein
MDPKRSGPGREGRDSGERRRERLDAAFQWAKELYENKRKELQKQGISGEELKRRLGSMSETADFLYRTQQAELDRRIDEKRKKLEQLAERRKKPSSKVGNKATREAGNLSSKFKERLDEKRKFASRSKENNETKTDRVKEAQKQSYAGKNKISDNRAFPLKDALKDARQLQQARAETSRKSKETKKQNHEKRLETPKRLQSKHSESLQEIARIHTKEQFEQIQQRHPNLELNKTHAKQCKAVGNYFEKLKNGENPSKPLLIEKLENLEVRYIYEIVNGKLPEVSIESMHDVDRYLMKNPEFHKQPNFPEHYRHCKVYFKVRDDWSKKEKELAAEHNISESTIGYYRRRESEPRLISELRRAEENYAIEKWANSHRLDKDEITKLQYSKQTEMKTEVTIDEPTSRLIETRIVKDSISSIQETKELGKEEIVNSIENMVCNSPELKSRVLVADLHDAGLDAKKLSDIEKTLQHNRNEIQESLKERLENIDDIRVGFVKNNFYVWIPESNQNDMVSAWKNQYFYFNNRELTNMMEKAGTRLGLGETKYDKYRNLNDLAHQLIKSSYEPIIIKKDNSRILGEALQFQSDTLGLRTKDFNCKVFKIAGANGVGGINNPQFLEGKKLEVERTRLFAIIKSDGWVSHDGKVGYIEKNTDRFNIVERNLQAWGDFKLTRYHDNVKRAYETKLPSPFWEALVFWGFSPGDKLIHNEGLPFDVNKISPESVKVYLGELIPEDGNFHPSRGFSWSRAVVIDAGKKTNDYEFKSLITSEIKNLIENNARNIVGPREEPRKELRVGALKDIMESPKSKETDRNHAKELMRVINENPCRLIEDEANLARRMTINVETNPKVIRYYPETDRVSVLWDATTVDCIDAEKWGIQFPPNDVKKRNMAKHWLLNRLESIEKTKLDLQSKRIPYDDWWS